MSLSAEIGRFLLVAGVYVGFTFLWGWYKGRQDGAEADTETAAEPEDDGDVGPAGGGA